MSNEERNTRFFINPCRMEAYHNRVQQHLEGARPGEGCVIQRGKTSRFCVTIYVRARGDINVSLVILSGEGERYLVNIWSRSSPSLSRAVFCLAFISIPGIAGESWEARMTLVG